MPPACRSSTTINSMSTPEATFSWPVRVYWEDTDGGGVVFYANYLKYMERSRTELLRSYGINQSQLAAEEGLIFAVVSTQVDYLRSARLDDELIVTCVARLNGRASFTFAQDIYRGGLNGELITRGSADVVCLDRTSHKPRRLPAALAQLLQSNGRPD
jgi:acyl-CoA thioester hydrolase